MQEGSGGINSVNNFLSSIGLMEPENPYIGGKLDDITVVVAIVNDNWVRNKFSFFRSLLSRREVEWCVCVYVHVKERKRLTHAHTHERQTTVLLKAIVSGKSQGKSKQIKKNNENIIFFKITNRTQKISKIINIFSSSNLQHSFIKNNTDTLIFDIYSTDWQCVCVCAWERENVSPSLLFHLIWFLSTWVWVLSFEGSLLWVAARFLLLEYRKAKMTVRIKASSSE